MNVILYLFLFFSVVLNIGLFWYLRQLAQNYTSINSDVYSVRDKTYSLIEHIDSVYNMDRIYGDSVIEGMISHMKDYNEQLKFFTERFTLSLDSEDLDREDNEKEEIN